MRILAINIQNFRKLLQCHIDFSKKNTLFVGANNSGKTSAMDALGKFLADRSFTFNDITISKRSDINQIGDRWIEEGCEEPVDLTEWELFVPKMDIWLDVSRNEIHYVAGIIPTLKWRGGKLGVRLAFLPKDISKLFSEYREVYSAARKTEKAKEKVEIRLYPKNLCEFLEKNLNTYFSIKTFILNPAKAEADEPQTTPFEMECFTDNPLKGIIKVDMIDAQRGVADPDNADGTERTKKQLSEQMRSYYDKHLDPEKSPSPEDLDILQATEEARKAFDINLAKKFEPAIHELEELGYPGIADPKLTIATKMSTGETLKHDAAVQYALSKSDDSLKLPEKYNGLSINGRHSHRLNPLIEKLCIPTLVIADIDSAENEGHHKAACPERGKGLISSNYTIAKWLVRENDLDKLLAIPSEKKEIIKETPYKYSIRVTYQNPVVIDYNGTDKEAIASTFEDCLVYTNYQLFKGISTDDTGSLVKSVSDEINAASSFEDFHKGVYEILRNGKSDQKAEFALDLIYAVDPNKLIVPAYIDEGLEWLQAYLNPEE